METVKLNLTIYITDEGGKRLDGWQKDAIEKELMRTARAMVAEFDSAVKTCYVDVEQWTASIEIENP